MQTNGTRIACNGCGVMVEGYGGSTCTARATAKWNTRASDAAADKLAGLLREVQADTRIGLTLAEARDLYARIDAALTAYDTSK